MGAVGARQGAKRVFASQVELIRLPRGASIMST